MNCIIAGLCILTCSGSCSHRNDNAGSKAHTTIEHPADTCGMPQQSAAAGLEDDTIPSGKDGATTPPSAKELRELVDYITERLTSLKGNPLQQNVWGIGVGVDGVEVSMAINTPYWQNEFRKNISDSPYIVFSGQNRPTRIAELVDSVAEFPSLTLKPDCTSFPIDAEYATFTLSNDGDCNISFGERYIIGYRDQSGIWYELPQTGICHDVGIELKPTGKYPFKAALNPRLNNNTPGTYRLYKQIRLEDNDDKVWIMTEFMLNQ
ncbi:MAG: hypothetical protein K2K93_03815 [Muribaculaceae bacterium]|nr:hypothetical protein [Muribaculaceae bacterium]